MNDFDSPAEQSTYSTVDAGGAGDENRGLYGKYRVERIDGKLKGPYFVLAYTSDPHAAVALAAYADSCALQYPQLAADLRAALAQPAGRTAG